MRFLRAELLLLPITGRRKCGENLSMNFYSFNSGRGLRQLFVLFCYFNLSVRYCIQTCLLLSLLLLPKTPKIKISQTVSLLLYVGMKRGFSL